MSPRATVRVVAVALLAWAGHGASPRAVIGITGRPAVSRLATASGVPMCDPGFGRRWRSARETHGVVVARERIFGFAARKFGQLFRRNWFPISASTETFCGRLTRFRWFDGPGRENDVNLFLEPPADTASAALLSEARDRGWIEPDFTDIEVEVTKPARIDRVNAHRFEYGYFRRPPLAGPDPDDGFYDGSPALQLRDRLLCTYGPWVTEWQSHAPKPEIHPAQLLWWADGEDRVFVHLQDASRRFDRLRDFNAYELYDGPRNPSWRPWNRPRQLDIAIAYELAPGTHRRLGLGTVPSHAANVGIADPAARSRARSRIDERTTLTVVESGDPGYLRVDIGAACHATDADTYRGFLRVRSTVGGAHPSELGYHLFRLTADGRPPDPLPIDERALDVFRERAEDEESSSPPASGPGAARSASIAREAALIGLTMRRLPSRAGTSLAGRFPDAFFADLGLPPERWQLRPGARFEAPSGAAVEAMVRYLNLAFFLVDDHRLLGTERARLRAALREVIDALDAGG